MLEIKKVNYDDTHTPGCETCDYGSSYINDIEIILADDTYLHIKIDRMYEYVFTESDFMQILGTSESLDDLYTKLFEYMKKKCWDGDIGMMICLQDLYMTINGKDVDIVKSCETNSLIFYDEEGK